MIEFAGVRRVFKVGDQEVAALRDINLELVAGEYVSIMGPSGSGKSTLLNLIGLLDRPTSGIYRLDGLDVTTLDDEAQARVRSEKIGFVFQFFHLVPRLTAAMPTTGPTSFPAVSASVWRSPARPACIRWCCLPMNRPAIWTRPLARK
jgi:putative ABC transport system ATP-binding protein